jgi:hypothetical protein
VIAFNDTTFFTTYDSDAHLIDSLLKGQDSAPWNDEAELSLLTFDFSPPDASNMASGFESIGDLHSTDRLDQDVKFLSENFMPFHASVIASSFEHQQDQDPSIPTSEISSIPDASFNDSPTL